ncbi:hypothetical protein GCM10011323_32140 [Pontibacter amylolyticus]|uniref:YhcG N-terminal domain-containing protein n=1 Tax=Pontibacter amylolyticus TaxID=1424080 RepID=A0ABQ1WEP9_9BACT|nr:hypothetical protein GCM10011323_32140 [Pontibacter amylolyticus]
MLLRWNIILAQQQTKGWGSKVFQTLSDDIRKEFPELQGFSCRNLLYMRQFASVYPGSELTQQPVAQLHWAHYVVLLGKNKVVAEYALKNIDKPIGISEYQPTEAIPENLQGKIALGLHMALLEPLQDTAKINSDQ